MSVLLVASALAATASVIATSSVAYILISFRRSGRVMASRIGHQSPAMVLLANGKSRRQQSPKLRSALRARQQQPAFAH